jgi:GTP-binding protein Era
VTRCGFCAILGRPNVGKSTLLNAVVGEKVSITAPSPNTTRHAVRGIVTRGDTQVIFVDTPGLHRPRTALGGRLNETARGALGDVDAILALVEAGADIGPGDRAVLRASIEAAESTGALLIVAVNKVDRAGKERTAAQLLAAQRATEAEAAELSLATTATRAEYYAISAKTGEGVGALVAAVREAMPESVFLFPPGELSDVPEARFIAELVREQLARKMREELPHSIHCRVTELEWPHVTVEILVERESQKGMVIGKGGRVLKDVGTAARRQLPEGCFLELRVRVEPGWQQRAEVLDRLGY